MSISSATSSINNFTPSSSSVFQINDRVIVDGGAISGGGSLNSDISKTPINNSSSNLERSGTIRFIGKTAFKDGDWLGIELDTPTGKNDGSVYG